MNSLTEKFIQMCKLEGVDFDIAYHQLRSEVENNLRNSDTKRFESHQDLIGRCYKHRGKYYKIISIKANNSCRISCLAFSEHPQFYFKHLFSKAAIYSEHAGEIVFEGVHTEDVMLGTKYKTIFGITDYKEITEEEFERAYRIYCEELLKADWRSGDSGD